MSALETWVAFTGACLEVGFGVFIFMRSMRVMRGSPVLLIPVASAFSLLGIALVAFGVISFVRVVPW